MYMDRHLNLHGRYSYIIVADFQEQAFVFADFQEPAFFAYHKLL